MSVFYASANLLIIIGYQWFFYRIYRAEIKNGYQTSKGPITVFLSYVE